MTRQSFERKLRAFVSDVPVTAPRDLLESVLIDLPTVKQRRHRFGAGRRFQTMSNPLRALALAAAGLVVAVAGFSLLRGPSGPGASPTGPSASPTVAPTPSAQATPAPSPRISGATVAPRNKPLDAGATYVLPLFEPPFTFSGPEGMHVGLDSLNFVFIVHPTSTGINAGVVRVMRVFTETGEAEEPPEDLAAWVQARTDLTISSSTPVTLGSVEGTLFEATVAEDAFQNAGGAINVFCPKPSSCDFEAGGSIGYERGDHVLILVTAVDGVPIAAIGTAPENDWSASGPTFDAWLRSIDFPG